MIDKMREWWHDPPARGRHRQGLPLVRGADCRWQWDTEQRSTAARLDRAERAWTILYGVGRRRFYAFAAWTVEEPLVIEAPTAEELREQMREAEMPRPSTAAQTWTAQSRHYEGKAA
ncbi:hypothetical protein AB0K60_25260 [Thermopolyspora sp. NPDC052614]|uniref:hypothetical protein n=1 Tax=Thermopolyspora sp. NPDC052614 TaxID=3155682 RepID=UPI0034162584